jgi:hypothetical protein
VTCNPDNKHPDANFQCTGQTPADAYICSYSSANPSEKWKDDRELNDYRSKQLIRREEVPANRYQTCKGNLNNDNPGTKDELDNQINGCHNTTNQSQKCEFYCPVGYHPEGNNLSNRKCVQNSVRKGITYPNLSVDGVKDSVVIVGGDINGRIAVEFDEIPCLDSGQIVSVKEVVRGTNGTWTVTGTFQAQTGHQAGTRKLIARTASLVCDPGYWEHGL